MKVELNPCNPHGHVLYVWTDAADFKWACCAYDHGPMCRRCRQVTGDGALDALIENVLLGHLWIFDSADRDDFTFKLTPEGEEHVEEIVSADPELRRLYEQAGLELMWQNSP